MVYVETPFSKLQLEDTGKIIAEMKAMITNDAVKDEEAAKTESQKDAIARINRTEKRQLYVLKLSPSIPLSS